jgi:hypothetical protein
MKFEEVLPALREGKKIRKGTWGNHNYDLQGTTPLDYDGLMSCDWEIVEEEHKKCPFCGGTANLGLNSKWVNYVICNNCCSSTSFNCGTPSEAWAAWDKRV